MSIASEIQRLSGVRSDIFTSITNKGVTVPPTATFSSCPSLIDSITGGGGGSPTSLINNTFTASGYLSAYRPFTATQSQVPQYEDTITSTDYSANYSSPIIKVPISSISSESFYSLSAHLTTDTFMARTTYTINLVSYDGSRNTQQTDNIGEIQYGGGMGITAFDVPVPKQYVISSWTSLTSQFQWQWESANWVANDYLWVKLNNFQSVTATDALLETLQLTGYDYPYPNYSITTTGYSENTIDLKESWENNGGNYNALLSSNNTLNIVYDDSPSNTSINSTNTANVSTFSSNMLKNKWGLDVSPIDTNYTYSYGTLTSGYSGFEGI